MITALPDGQLDSESSSSPSGDSYLQLFGTQLEGMKVPAHLIVLVSVSMGVATFGLCYGVAWNGLSNYFLSSAISNTPESNLGTLGLVPAIICLPVIGLV